MSIRRLVASLALTAAALPAWAAAAPAADREPVTFNDGTTGMAVVVATTVDSVTAKFVRKGAEVETVLPVARLDPVSFYEIRRRHMESTPENHVRLAMHCAENGLVNQARFQLDMARALDPEIEQKMKDRPDVTNAIAARLIEAAWRHFDRGELEAAHNLVQIVATRFTETPAAANSEKVLDMIEKKIAERKVTRAAARLKKIEESKDAAARAEAERREGVVAGLEKAQAAARKKESGALRQRNSNNAKTDHEAAAVLYAALLADIAAAKKAAGGDTDLVGMIAELEDDVRTECADSLINSGIMELPRSNFDLAEAAGRRALAVCPGYGRATAFLESVDVAREQAEEFRNLKISRERR